MTWSWRWYNRCCSRRPNRLVMLLERGGWEIMVETSRNKEQTRRPKGAAILVECNMIASVSGSNEWKWMMSYHCIFIHIIQGKESNKVDGEGPAVVWGRQDLGLGRNQPLCERETLGALSTSWIRDGGFSCCPVDLSGVLCSVFCVLNWNCVGLEGSSRFVS
jgi:hypothetical protein